MKQGAVAASGGPLPDEIVAFIESGLSIVIGVSQRSG